MAKDKTNFACTPGHQAGGAIYGLGLLGALVYFVPHAPGLADKLAAVLKALVWPAFLVYYALQFLKV